MWFLDFTRKIVEFPSTLVEPIILNKNTYLENNTYFVHLHVLWPQSHPLATAEKHVHIHFVFSFFFFLESSMFGPVKIPFQFMQLAANENVQMEWSALYPFFFSIFLFLHKIRKISGFLFFYFDFRNEYWESQVFSVSVLFWKTNEQMVILTHPFDSRKCCTGCF